MSKAAGKAPAAGHRVRLNRDRVLVAAIAVADRVGIGGLSMRRLADDLGVAPMALYKHVANREELLDGMVEAVITGIEAPRPDLDWKAGVRARILDARRVMARHPWARRALETRTRRTAAVLAYQDSLAGQFMAGGLSADLTHHVMHTLGNRIWGFSPELFNDPSPDGQPRDDAPDDASHSVAPPVDQSQFAAQFPHIVAIYRATTDARPGASGCDEQFEFEFALDLLLDGIERLHRQGWTSGSGAGRA